MTNKQKKITWAAVSVLILFIITAAVAHKYYKSIWKPNVNKTGYLFIPENADFKQVCDSLSKNNFVKDIESFKKISKLKKYTKIKAGRYEIIKDWSNNSLINTLRAGNQKPVKITFNNIRNLDIFAGKISKKIMADSASLSELFKNEDYIKKYGFKKHTVISMFIPDTYEMYWNTSAQEFFEFMANQYKLFWDQNRKNKANKLGMSQTEVSTLASIVQAEQSAHNDEKPIIAGLYINRLKQNMLLQSDPTVVFALNDFEKKRVLNSDKEINSPYNTYKFVGLPPGPINMPEKSSIDAVLNYQKHNFIFMCAKEDFSGYHYFSTNARQHEIYADRYRNALNKLKIWK